MSVRRRQIVRPTSFIMHLITFARARARTAALSRKIALVMVMMMFALRRVTPTAIPAAVSAAVLLLLLLLQLLIFAMFLPFILGLAAQEGASESSNDAVPSLVAQETSTEPTCDGAHEAALAFLRVVWVDGVAFVTVRVARVAGWWRALAPRSTLAVILLAAILVLTARKTGSSQ